MTRQNGALSNLGFRHGRSKRAIAALAVVAALAFVGLDSAPDSAEAGWGGISGNTGCSAVNAARAANLGGYYWNLSSQMADAQEWFFGNIFNPTDLYAYPDPVPTTDLVYRDLDYSTYCGYDWYAPGQGGITGLTTCDSLVASGACKTHSIRFSTVYTNSASVTARRGLACHETGHAIGLTHATSSTTCMTPGNSATVNQWNPTEIGWINAFY